MTYLKTPSSLTLLAVPPVFTDRRPFCGGYLVHTSEHPFEILTDSFHSDFQSIRQPIFSLPDDTSADSQY